MQFGKQEETEIIDDEGSTLTLERNFNAGVAMKPKRLHYEIRHRTDLIDLESLTQLAKALIADPLKLDTSLKFEKTKSGDLNGYYHIVECYTLLEY